MTFLWVCPLLVLIAPTAGSLLLLWLSPYVPGAYPSRGSMSDDEFVAACGPGTDREVALGVRRIVSEKLSIPYDEIRPSDRFVEDLKAD